ncbi:ATP-dependent DNA helicase RecG [Anaerobacillus isosaccharinicus]|uniref:ATP-dependent DNA helicase RecG n=1 Tax=Anaerobacillus isosaccharinicus TaxID=1532552 RepID=A0A1S2L998_9BACI|nr:ATP-dependent DNA helicase RecG [Anaerobacillus isosaccharinicus]MBA5587377.1 ATP-dependent DNA helicase RecG [Anaerobacillus isosaccharinicus]QOY34430.1 ATP-dependent DNA helicase RecG [Anaerobacillus isosaccharinicus]
MLNSPTTVVKGIGEEKAKDLYELGIYTVKDLLEYFPFRYEDYRPKEIQELKHEERATIIGLVQSESVVRFFGRKKSKLSVRILAGNVLLTAVFFNQHYLKTKLVLGATVTLTGKWDQHRLTLTVNECKFTVAEPQESYDPVYSVGGKITVKALKKMIASAMEQYGHLIPEILPPVFLQKYKLVERKYAIHKLHYPKSFEDAKHARRRMVYEEFLLFQLKMQALRKFHRENSGGTAITYKREEVEVFISTLPFPLTSAQQRVVREILTDMQSSYRMNRLLQGDVGSGKTVVAAICLYASVTASLQGALMVPTEILAEQHAHSLKQLLEPLNVKVELLTGSVKGKKRKELLQRLETGELQVIVGTHALIQDEVVFRRLGLVITDEQHRFGVEQRRTLRNKGQNPDVLFMTATPIPRTLAISIFGDMDVSTIDEMPAGRKPIETYWAKHHMLERVLGFVQKELAKGRQAYVICPLIEESEKLDVQNAIDVHAQLQQFFNDYQVGLMHGRLTPSDKDAVMQRFSKNEVQILVSTTVVEVGVNVPNATMMVIYDAERFGLSQLHQLRGRVGRGDAQSYCVLLADPKSDVGKERMKIMTETNDGFELSQRDLELRGPGDFFGSKQSGLPEFKIADMIHDYRALEVARNDAVELVSSSTFWNSPEYKYLVMHLEEQGVLAGDKMD